MHVASALLGGSDEGRRRHRTSGVAAAEAGEEEEDVWSCRRRSCQPEMSDHGCIHLNNFKAAKGIQPYKVIHAYFVTSTSTEARVRKVRCSLLFLACNSRSRFSRHPPRCHAVFKIFRFCSPLRLSRSFVFPMAFLSSFVFVAFHLFLLVSLTPPYTILDDCRRRFANLLEEDASMSRSEVLAGRLKMSTELVQ